MYKIMLVDDDDFICDLYHLFLTKQGCEVTIAYDGLDGLEKLKIKTPDIILLDLMMPRMSGIDMLDQLKSEELMRDIPVFIFSNLSDPGIVEVCLQKGAVEFLVKSQHIPETIFKKIDDHLKLSAKTV